MSKRRTWRWVTLSCDTVNIWPLAHPKPYWDALWELWDTDGCTDCADVCEKEFRRLTGLKIPTGRPVKVEFTARILED